MKTSELRQAYLEYFRAKEHKVFPSDSLVPHNDASLLFTGAGMNQFKPYFLGLKKDVKRAASCQKCLRMADLDRVGKTAYHHSFFEMLGNFSFGDYFKEEAIAWGWEFVTKVLKLPEKKLWVSVYREDEEAFKIWKNEIGLPESKIVQMGPEENFWPANAPKDGPNGPCGPCSEIYVGETPGKGVEIWNLVFTQFDRQSDGSLKPLPQKNIDTGMGLERTASVLQGVDSNFDIDIFSEFRKELKGLLKKGSNETAHENAVMDHARAAVFCITDGALPSNEGRGYVVRKLVRLGCDHLTQAGAESGHFKDAVVMVARMMGDAYPEIIKKQNEIVKVIEYEENAILEITRTKVPKFERKLAAYLREHSVSGKDKPQAIAEIAFEAYDTDGVSKEIIKDRVAKAIAPGLLYNKTFEFFDQLINQQKDRSRASSKIAGEIFKKSDLYGLTEGLPATEFFGYAGCEGGGKLLRVLGDDLWVFDRTPFYAESGGQIGDTGKILGNGVEADVLDTQAHEKIVLHKVSVKKGKPEPGKSYELKVDAQRRADIMNNHTGTHLLHAALRKVLGEHVKQAGSLVAPDYLRFDFAHFKGLTPDELAKVETMVNEEIRKNTPLNKQEMTREEAAKSGAIAFFGEKYGERVRVVSVGDFSKEFCGGTHLRSTGEIGLFRVVSESSIQAGVRRIEAVTGRWAQKLEEERKKEVEDLCAMFGTGKEGLADEIIKRSKRVAELRNRLAQITGEKMKQSLARELSRTAAVNDTKLVVMTADGATVEIIKIAADYLKIQPGQNAALFTSRADGKVTFAVAGSGDFVSRGFNAGAIVKKISPVVEGSGGGRPEFAVGGGKNISKISEAVEMGRKAILQ